MATNYTTDVGPCRSASCLRERARDEVGRTMRGEQNLNTTTVSPKSLDSGCGRSGCGIGGVSQVQRRRDGGGETIGDDVELEFSQNVGETWGMPYDGTARPPYSSGAKPPSQGVI